MGTEVEPQAPCLAACPVHTDTRGYAECIAEGRYEEALDLLLAANPFTSVCGRICHHPCEQSCRRAQVDAPVALRQLKRFVVEATGDYRQRRRAPVEHTRSERIAIIGAGPAGLTAAHDLARAGFGVTVFEAADTPGGMLGQTIPRYRLPYAVLREDIDDILALGVELRTGCAVGKEVQLAQLQRDFEVVLIATGLSESRALGVPGIDSRGVLLALPFLRAVAAGRPPALGDRVVVIGGGNVAMDVARSARRLGASEVTAVSLESRKELPAWDWEVQEALDEGVKLAPSWGPKEVLTTDGAVTGIVLKRCVRVFDEQGKFSPSFDDSETTELPADSIVLSIGQRADLACIQGSQVTTRPGDRLEYDPETMATSERGVFACGEVVTGPGAAVEAVADAHRAARAISHFLDTGELLRQAPKEELPALSELPDDVLKRVRRRGRVEVPLMPAEARVRDFSEFEPCFSESEASAEARRCLACTAGAVPDEERCAACMTCVRVCPFGVATVTSTAAMPAEKCQACGLCAAVCPAAAIALKRFAPDRPGSELQRLAGALGAAAPPTLVVSFGCLFATTSRRFLKQTAQEVKDTGVARVVVPCVARLSVPDLLKPFEMGAAGVCVIACAEGDCAYPTADEQLAMRVEQVRRILDELGLGRERLELARTVGTAEASWPTIWDDFKTRLERAPVEQRGETE
jgi:NADPH-dependent glutamate synthase beta subunit-like oxidoreductase/coenzyme F420-reducing hydrogenase delta subunit